MSEVPKIIEDFLKGNMMLAAQFPDLKKRQVVLLLKLRCWKTSEIQRTMPRLIGRQIG